MSRLHCTVIARLTLCGLSGLAGFGLAAALLAALAPTQAVRAAPQLPSEQIVVTTTIQAAIDAANPGDTVLVPAGIYTESLTLGKAVSLTGVSSATVIVHALTGQRVLTVTGAAIDSSVVISGFTLTGGHATLGGGILLTGNAQPLLSDLTLSQNQATDAGGGLYADVGSQLTLVSVSVLSNTSEYQGGGAYADISATVTGAHFQGNVCIHDGCIGGGLRANTLALTDTEFLSNTSSGAGGGFLGVTAMLTGGRFQGNACTGTNCVGGGLRAITLTLSDTEFISNSSTTAGGGAFAAGAATLTGGRFQGNTCTDAGCSGGGLRADTLVLTGTELIGNTSHAGGGGSHAWSTATSVGGRFQGNTCTEDGCSGGGLYAGTLVLSDTEFISNTSITSGGGGYAWGAATLSGGRFQGNTCTWTAGTGCSGGGLYAGTLVLSDTEFISNTSIAGGGGFSGVAATLTGGRFQGNTCTGMAGAGCYGGGLYASALVLSDTEFISNSSITGGGGAFAGGPTTLSGGQFRGNACAPRQHNTEAGCVGGGLFAGGGLTATSTQFIANWAERGAGAAVTGGGQVVNSLFARNSASAGAALYLDGSGSVAIVHTTIASPTLAVGTAVYVVGGTAVLTNTLVASHSIALQNLGGMLREDYTLFAGNTLNTYGSVISGGHSLSGSAGFLNPAADDYHLTDDSAAVNAGTNAGVTTDFEGDARPLGGVFDIGFDESPFTAISNVAPVAVSDIYSTLPNATLTLSPPGVLGNDSDGDNDTLTAYLIAGPLTGTLDLHTNGGFTYTPPLGFFGITTFNYLANDGLAESNIATVTITVTPIKVYLPLVLR